MNMRPLFAAATAFAVAMSLTSAASAKTFTSDIHDAGIWNYYDDTNEAYAMKYKAEASKDGFWLVVSDGPNPKDNANEYAILYGDTKANRITAYTYDGENSADSFKTGTLLGSYENVFSPAGTHPKYGYDLTMFTLDVAEINSAFGGEWDGVQLGMQSGIWFHQSEGSDFTYGADGGILDYTFSDQMFTDRAFVSGNMRNSPDCSTERGSAYARAACTPTALTPAGGGGSVPAPGGLALLAVGLFGMRRLRNRT